jgi:hypothetical protein
MEKLENGEPVKKGSRVKRPADSFDLIIRGHDQDFIKKASMGGLSWAKPEDGLKLLFPK